MFTVKMEKKQSVVGYQKWQLKEVNYLKQYVLKEVPWFGGFCAWAFHIL